MLLPTFTRAQLTRQHSEPKTILGFFLAFFALFSAAAVGVVIALVATGHGALAAVVLAAAFLTAIGILCWVARVQTKDPTALMLGQVTAEDYLAIQQWTAGDSTHGERSALPPVLGIPGAAPAALPPPGHEIVSSDDAGADTPTDDVGQAQSSTPAAGELALELPPGTDAEPESGES